MRLASLIDGLRLNGTLVWILVSAAAVLVLVAALPLPLTDADPALYGTIAKRAMASGDWLTFRNPRYAVVDKPPLAFWLMGVSFILFGTGEWALRVWHLALALGTAGATYALARLDLPRREALAAAAVLLSTLQFFYLSLVPEQHVPLVLFLTLAMYWELRWERDVRWWAPILVGLCAGLAVLSIGIPGAAMTGLVLGAHLLLDRPRLPPRPRLAAAWGAAVFVAVGAPWFVVGVVRQGRPFVETFLLGGTLGVARFFHQVQVSPTVVPWWAGFGAYLLLLPLGFLPWTGWLWPGLREGWAARQRRPSILWTCTVWSLAVLAFLSASPGDKASRYLLPAFPPLAVLVGHAVADRRWARQAAAVSIAAALPLLGLVIAVALVKFPQDQALYAPLLWWFLPAFVAGLIVQAAAAFIGRPRGDAAALAFVTLLSYALAVGVVGRVWDRASPWRPVARIVNGHDLRGAPVLMLGQDNTFIDFYVARPVRYVDGAELARAWRREQVVAIVPIDALPSLPASPRPRQLGQAVAGVAVVTNLPAR